MAHGGTLALRDAAVPGHTSDDARRRVWSGPAGPDSRPPVHLVAPSAEAGDAGNDTGHT